MKIVVIGLQNAGLLVVKALRKQFKKNLEIVVIERQKEIFHNVAAPRAVVECEVAEKCFISLEKIFLPDGSEGKVIHGTVESFTNSQVTLVDKTVISFDYLVIASGAMYDSPWKIQCESKDAGLKLLKDCSEKIKNSPNVVIIGGGPTGIETAAEIKSTYPEKKVTVVQNEKLLAGVNCADKHRLRLQQKLEKMGIEVVYGRVNDLPKDVITAGSHEVVTSTGIVISSDLTLKTTGKIQPNSGFVDKSLLTEENFVKVKTTLQLDDDGFQNVFSLGDVANTGSSKTLIHVANQAIVVAQNIAVLAGKSGQLKQFIAKEMNLVFYSLGRKDGFAVLPWMPGFVSDFMVKSFKSPDMFISKAKGDFNM